MTLRVIGGILEYMISFFYINVIKCILYLMIVRVLDNYSTLIS